MESYSNFEEESARKRTSEENQNGDKEAKRRNLGTQPLLKLLVPNYAAGALIGKGGSLLTELRSKYGGNLRLSANKEFYPGTDERVVVITGEVSQIIDLNNHIMEIVQEPGKNRPQSIRDKQVKVVLTNFVAGLLIGKGGETVKAINEQSKAKLNITQRDGSSVPGERLLTMSGSMDERTEGCKMVIEKIATDESNMKNTNLKYTASGTDISANYGNGNDYFAPSAQNVAPYGGNNQFAPPTQNSMPYKSNNQFGLPSQNAMHYGNNNQFSTTQNAMPFGGNDQFSPPSQNAMSHGMGGISSDKCPLKATVKVQMEVPDNLVTVLMGKEGQVVKKLAQASGARFRFSDKNDFVPGTKNRMLTITGNMDQSETAHSLVQQKVDSETGRQQGQQWGMY